MGKIWFTLECGLRGMDAHIRVLEPPDRFLTAAVVKPLKVQSETHPGVPGL